MTTRRVVGALALSLGINALMVPVVFLKARMSGMTPPTFTWDRFAISVVLLFVATLVFWPRGLPLPFDKAPPDGGDEQR